MTSREDRLAAEIGARLDGCPDAEQLQWFAEAALAAEERQRVQRHAAGCPACTRAIEWLHDALADEGGPDTELPQDVEARTERLIGAATDRAPSQGRSLRRAGGGLVAAAVLALAAIGLWQLREASAPRAPVYREVENGAIHSLIPDDQRLPRNEFVLRWSVGGDVSHYNLLLSTAALDPIDVVKGLTEPEHVVDASLLHGVGSGEKLIWQVEAVRPGGASIRSETFVTTVE